MNTTKGTGDRTHNSVIVEIQSKQYTTDYAPVLHISMFSFHKIQLYIFSYISRGVVFDLPQMKYNTI